VWEGDEQEMFKLQDRIALIPIVSIKTLTLIVRMTIGVGVNFVVYFSHNAIPT
jgi:hypothetical protein